MYWVGHTEYEYSLTIPLYMPLEVNVCSLYSFATNKQNRRWHVWKQGVKGLGGVEFHQVKKAVIEVMLYILHPRCEA